MTIQERCKTAEAKLEEISTALLDYRPETLEACEAELQEIAGLLAVEGTPVGVECRLAAHSLCTIPALGCGAP